MLKLTIVISLTIFKLFFTYLQKIIKYFINYCHMKCPNCNNDMKKVFLGCHS